MKPAFLALTVVTGLAPLGSRVAAQTNLSPPRAEPVPVRLATHAKSSSPAQIKPGTYKTEPYTCIVVAPGPHPDDRAVVGIGGGNDRMPKLQPDLRFIPRSSSVSHP
jgi:hypothetical protein